MLRPGDQRAQRRALHHRERGIAAIVHRDAGVRGSTAVCPCDRGAGCEATGVSLTLIVRPPCAIATGLIRTSALMTTVPDASLMTMRAASLVDRHGQILDIAEQVDDIAAIAGAGRELHGARIEHAGSARVQALTAAAICRGRQVGFFSASYSWSPSAAHRAPRAR